MIVRPLIATPCYGSMLCLNYVTSIIGLERACASADIPLEFYFRQDSLITRARNDCVAHFLAGECTHLFFIDADIGFEPDAALRLMRSGRSVAAGVYPIKSEGAGFPIDMGAVGSADKQGLAEANEAPTGFMCIARHVLQAVNHPFDEMRDGDEHLSEDYAFCRRWRDRGGAIHVDTHSAFTHQGTKLYIGDFKAALESRK